jgi:hypothetical protein
MHTPGELPHEFVNKNFDNYHETDMQFNIGRIEGQIPRGQDIVDESGNDRYYIAPISSHQAADQLVRKFGPEVVLPVVDIHDGAVVYEVMPGSRLMAKTLQQAPYGEKYMQKLAHRTGRFLRAVRKLDAGLYGLNIEGLAVTYHEDEDVDADDTFLTIVPPLAEPGATVAVDNEHIMLDASRYIHQQATRKAFWQGLNGEGL